MAVGYDKFGSLTIRDGATLNSTQTIIGYFRTGVGELNVTGRNADGTASTWNGQGVILGYEGNGTINVINGGHAVTRSIVAGFSRGAVGNIRVAGTDEQGNPSLLVNENDITLGQKRGGTGNIVIEDGGQVQTRIGHVGFDRLAFGNATIRGSDKNGNASRWTLKQELIVGDEGIGTLLITDGGEAVSPMGYVGYRPIGNGNAIVSGAAPDGRKSKWSVGEELSIGHWGTGALTIKNGGEVTVKNDEGVSGIVHLGQMESGKGTLNFGSAIGAPVDLSGNLDAAEIRFGDGAGLINFNHRGELTLGARLVKSGAGSAIVNHHRGTTTLTGDSSTFSGVTTVSGGTLNVGDKDGNGSLGGTITVGYDAKLGGGGTIGSADGAVTILEGGIHEPGYLTGTQAVEGNYVNHGTLSIGVSPESSSGIIAKGQVDIANAILKLTFAPEDPSAWSLFRRAYTLIDKQSEGAISGEFASIEKNLVYLDPKVSYTGGDGNDLVLQLTRNQKSISSAAQTQAQDVTGRALDTLDDSSEVLRTIVTARSEQDASERLAVLSGEVHASVQSQLINDARSVRDLIATHSDEATDRGVWMIGTLSSGEMQNGSGNERLVHDANKILIGVDTLVGDWQVGIYAGHGKSTGRIGSLNSSANTDSYHVGGYFDRVWDQFTVSGGAGYTAMDVNVSRTVRALDFSETVGTQYLSHAFNVFGGVGYKVLETTDQNVELFADLEYVKFYRSAFAETGGVAALRGTDASRNLLFSTIGLRTEHKFTLGDRKAALSGLIGWQAAAGDTGSASTHAFTGSNSFTVDGIGIAENSVKLGAALNLFLQDNAKLGVSYGGLVSGQSQAHSVKANLAVSF